MCIIMLEGDDTRPWPATTVENYPSNKNKQQTIYTSLESQHVDRRANDRAFYRDA